MIIIKANNKDYITRHEITKYFVRLDGEEIKEDHLKYIAKIKEFEPIKLEGFQNIAIYDLEEVKKRFILKTQLLKIAKKFLPKEE